MPQKILDYILGTKSIDEEEEYASYIYEAQDSNGNIYYYYDEPRNDYKTHAERMNGFYISYKIKPYACIHTHGSYDANTNNTKDGFSTPDNHLNSATSDVEASDASGFDYYVVTPIGNLYKYESNSGNYDGELISSEMYGDARQYVYYNIKNTLMWKLLINKFPNATPQDIVNAKLRNVKWSDAINELKEME